MPLVCLFGGSNRASVLYCHANGSSMGIVMATVFSIWLGLVVVAALCFAVCELKRLQLAHDPRNP